MEDKCHYSWCIPIFPSLPQLLLLSVTSYGMDYPFGQLGSALLAAYPSKSLCTPSLLAVRAAYEAGKTLTLCKQCSATTKISTCYHHFHKKSKTQNHMSIYEEKCLYPSQNHNASLSTQSAFLPSFLRMYSNFIPWALSCGELTHIVTKFRITS